MRKIILLLLVFLLTSCTIEVPHTYTDAEINGKKYTCENLEEGIYSDEYNRKYHLGYELKSSKLKFYLVRVNEK